MQDNTKLWFTNTDVWIDFLNPQTAYLGITSFASECFKNCQSLEIASVGKAMKQGDILASVYSVASDGDIFCPFDCYIEDINTELSENPNLLMENPYRNWVAKVTVQGDTSHLLSYEEYLKLVK